MKNEAVCCTFTSCLTLLSLLIGNPPAPVPADAAAAGAPAGAAAAAPHAAADAVPRPADAVAAPADAIAFPADAVAAPADAIASPADAVAAPAEAVVDGVDMEDADVEGAVCAVCVLRPFSLCQVKRWAVKTKKWMLEQVDQLCCKYLMW